MTRAALPLLLLLGVAGGAASHPMGTMGIDHYAGLEIAPDTLRVKYLLDFAEVPSVRELDRVDPDLDSRVTPEEREAYLETRTAEVLANLKLEINGRRLPLQATWSRVVFLDGDGGMTTVRIAWELAAPAPDSLLASNFLNWNDRNHPEAVGWKEIRFAASGGLGIGAASIPERSIGGDLGELPEVLPSEPPQDTSAWCRFGPGMERETAPPARSSGGPGRGILAAAGAAILLGGGLLLLRGRRRR